jgi:predicted dithiol-disulfide oxidoreductase (DUF899 family)
MKSKEAKAAKALTKAEAEFEKARKKLLKLRKSQPKELIKDYEFVAQDGSKQKLSELFGAKEELILVHNMGSTCTHCTLWADGFNGLVPHLEDRAAFVVESGEESGHQKEFYGSRGWRFRMVSSQGTDFKKDMGFADRKGNPQPGVSVFTKKKGKIHRVAKDGFGDGDDYCVAWHFFDLLPKGAKGWRPQYSYDAPAAKEAPTL